MSTAKIFDELFWRYDDWYKRNKVTAENELRLIRKMLSSANYPAIDVGIGTGFFASELGIDFGLDPSLNMLSLARIRGLNRLIAGVGERMPFRDECFGTVLIVVTLCFVDNPYEVLRESWRVLKPGGTLISCVVPRDSSWGDHYTKLGSLGHSFYSKARFYTTREVVSMIEETSFRVEGFGGILSYGPFEVPKEEEPSEKIEGMGFVCIKAVKAMRG